MIYKRQQIKCFDDAQCIASFVLAVVGAAGAFVQLLILLKVPQKLAEKLGWASNDPPPAEGREASGSRSPLLQSPDKSTPLVKAEAGAAPGSEPAAEPFSTKVFKAVEKCTEAVEKVTGKLA